MWVRGSLGERGLSLEFLRLFVPLDEPPVLEGVAEGGDGFAPARIDRRPAVVLLETCGLMTEEIDT